MGEIVYAQERFDRWQPEVVPQVRLAIPVGELAQENWTKKRFNTFLGTVALDTQVQANPEIKQKPTKMDLHEALSLFNTSPEAKQMTEINAATAIYEVSFKTDHVSRIFMDTTPEGEFIQFGQTAASIQRNSLQRPNRPAALQEITKVEALNSHRSEDLNRAGTLDDYWYVVPSLVPEGVAEEHLGEDGDGYFLSSMTYAIQATTRENGRIMTESGFQAGVIDNEEDSFEDRMSKRHDLAAIQIVCEQLGMTPPQTTTEALNGHLVHKSLMPNGVTDFMKWCDQAADAVTGIRISRDEAFYGNLWTESQKREDSLSDVKQAVITKLHERFVQGLCADKFATTAALWEIARAECMRASINNEYIKPEVWGVQGARDIVEVRQAVRRGDYGMQMRAWSRFEQSAVATGCGGGAKAKQKTEGEGSMEGEGESSMAGSGGASGGSNAEAEEIQNLPAKIRCIECNVKSPRNQVIKHNSWRCPHCKYEVDICDGSVINASQKAKPAVTFMTSLSAALQTRTRTSPQTV